MLSRVFMEANAPRMAASHPVNISPRLRGEWGFCGFVGFSLPMGTSSSKNEPEDDRGVKGFFTDIVAANQVAPYFRFEGCQLFFASISGGNLTDQTYK